MMTIRGETSIDQQAITNMFREIVRLRSLNAELLAACEGLIDIDVMAPDIETPEVDADIAYGRAVSAAMKAIAHAKEPKP